MDESQLQHLESGDSGPFPGPLVWGHAEPAGRSSCLCPLQLSSILLYGSTALYCTGLVLYCTVLYCTVLLVYVLVSALRPLQDKHV